MNVEELKKSAFEVDTRHRPQQGVTIVKVVLLEDALQCMKAKPKNIQVKAKKKKGK